MAMNENAVILQALYAKREEILKDMQAYDFLYNQTERSFSTKDEFVQAMQEDINSMQVFIDMYHTVKELIAKYQELEGVSA